MKKAMVIVKKVKNEDWMENRLYDVIIIGGGPAGLSAALILGRCLRDVVVFDSGKPRNYKAVEMHGFLSQDGTNPMEFIRKAKQEVESYKVEILEREIISATSTHEGTFELKDNFGQTYYSKMLLIATGLVDDVPKIEGVDKMYGKSIFHCPYCDGYEVRLKPLAVYGSTKSGSGLAVALSQWSDDVVLCTDGKKLDRDEMQLLKLKQIRVESKKIARLEGYSGYLKRVVFEDGTYIEREALFFTTDKYQRSNIAAQLGCQFTSDGLVKADKFQHTNVPGVFVAGDAAKDMQLVIIAAAEGAKAAVVINKILQKESMKLAHEDTTLKKV